MANILRSDFLGTALQSSTASSSKPAQRVQTQALFKKAEKTAKRQASSVTQKAKGAVGKAQKTAKKAQKTAPSPIKKAQKAVSGNSKRTKGWLGGAGGAQGLDKWYGECNRQCKTMPIVNQRWQHADKPVAVRRSFSRTLPSRRPPRPLRRPQLPEWYLGWRVSRYLPRLP